MRSAKSTIPKEIKALGWNKRTKNFLLCASFFILSASKIFSQDNSPYSRYGLGDIVPNTNIVNRAMGGISAGYSDPLTVNFNNPASYSTFMTRKLARAKKSIDGRVILDVGMNFDTRTLREGNPPSKFTVSNALFSYMQVGIPLRKNWGLSFGLRPVSKIAYDIVRRERLYDPNTGLPIDSSFTEFTGNGGVFLPSIGTGVAFGEVNTLSIGLNVGYLFGRKEYSTKRAFINDTVQYNNANYTTSTSFGKVVLNGGIQYKITFKKDRSLTLGAFGNLKQNLNASQDIVRETFVRDPNRGDLTLDSVYYQKGLKGKIIYPSSYTVGFVYERELTKDYSGFLLGIDLIQTQWSEYRYYGTTDAVKNNMELRFGTQLRPIPKSNYFSNVDYRAGFFIGQDYINLGNKLPVFGISFGLGLPIPNTNPLARGQFTRVNVALEYNKRGNNANLLKEDMFRVSLGMNFSDLWFGKHKYD
jgi:hypothetical protein